MSKQDRDAQTEDVPFNGPDRRAESNDQRSGAVVDRRSGMDRRRGPGRRRSEIRRAAEEGQHSGELYDFIRAVDEYKRVNKCPFPTWSQVFEIIHYLGYRKVAEQADHIDTPTDANVLNEEEAASSAC